MEYPAMESQAADIAIVKDENFPLPLNKNSSLKSGDYAGKVDNELLDGTKSAVWV